MKKKKKQPEDGLMPVMAEDIKDIGLVQLIYGPPPMMKRRRSEAEMPEAESRDEQDSAGEGENSEK